MGEYKCYGGGGVGTAGLQQGKLGLGGELGAIWEPEEKEEHELTPATLH